MSEQKNKCPKCNGKGRTALLGKCWECNGTGKIVQTEVKLGARLYGGIKGKKRLDRSILSKDIVKEIRRITDAPTRADLKPLQKMLQDLSDELDSPQNKTKSIGQIIGEFAYNKPTYEFTEKEKEQADKVADHIHELYVLSGYGKADRLHRSTSEMVALVYVGNDHYQTTERVPDDTPSGSDYWSCYIPKVIAKKLGLKPERHKVYELILTDQSLALFPDLLAKLKQAVKDARDGKDVDLPEELYEVFCSIQNQAIEEATKQ